MDEDNQVDFITAETSPVRRRCTNQVFNFPVIRLQGPLKISWSF